MVTKQTEISRPVEALVRNQFRRDSESSELIGIHKFATEPARVSVDYQLTLNLGNFESAKIGISLTVPCYFEQIDDAHAFAQKWVEDRVNKEKDMIRAEIVKAAGGING